MRKCRRCHSRASVPTCTYTLQTVILIRRNDSNISGSIFLFEGRIRIWVIFIRIHWFSSCVKHFICCQSLVLYTNYKWLKLFKYINIFRINVTLHISLLVKTEFILNHTVCPRSSDPILCSNLLYKMGHYFLDIQ